MQEQLKPKKPRKRANPQHIVLFVIACLILAISLFCLAMLAGYLYDSSQPPAESVESEFPGGEIIGGFLAAIATLFLVGVSMLVFAMIWGVGMLVSAYVAFCKQEIPRPLRTGARVLTGVFTVLVIGALGLVGYVILVLFV